jgi:hypothetical protein
MESRKIYVPYTLTSWKEAEYVAGLESWGHTPDTAFILTPDRLANQPSFAKTPLQSIY